LIGPGRSDAENPFNLAKKRKLTIVSDALMAKLERRNKKKRDRYGKEESAQ